ncbi:L,D-transpeptidase family protein [Actinopolymorpha sp. NPDC004070]|uniref:L,D-transpeptidase family protein n=1 Tax=Actinopolymorpha sp. NPDC004070 TaxID=3154548 RepID=UPI0033BFA3AA
MRNRRLAAVIAAVVLAVAALGGVAYGAGLPPFAHKSTAITDASARSHRPAADPARPTPTPSAGEKTPGKATPTTPAPRAPRPKPLPSRTPKAAPTPTPTPTATAKPSPKPEPKPKALMNVGARSDQVRELEARLHQLDWLSTAWIDGYFGTSTRKAVYGYQGKHGLEPLGYVDSATWHSLREATRTPTHDELYPPKPKPRTGPLDPRCTTGRTVCIDKSTRSLRWVVDGNVRLTMDVRFGCPSSPTREGTFQIRAKVRHGYSNWYDSAMPFAMFFSGDEAVHYSSDFAARGYNGCSHGCVNVRNWNALAQLFSEARVGDKVVVYWS